MNKKPTSTLFWAKHLGLALAVIIVAGIVIHLQMNMTSAPTPVDAPEERSVAKGLSDFYREFRMTANQSERSEGADMVLDLWLLHIRPGSGKIDRHLPRTSPHTGEGPGKVEVWNISKTWIWEGLAIR